MRSEGESNSKTTGITGNYILELVLVQLEKEVAYPCTPAPPLRLRMLLVLPCPDAAPMLP